MNSAGLLEDAFERVRGSVHRAVEGLSADELAYRAGADANSIAWLVWHLTRVQDDHVADVAGTDQAWTADGWHARFDLPLPASDTGYAHTSAQVAQVRVADPDLLAAYHDAVCDRTLTYVRTLRDDDLDQVIDEHWDPPVTLGVRLVSVIADDLQHAGQAAFLRGLVQRR